MTGRRLLAVLAGAFLFLPAPAYAQSSDYPPPSPDLTVNHGTVAPGGSVDVTGTVSPGDTVTITACYSGGNCIREGTVTAGCDGSFSLALALSSSGTVTITAVGSPSGHTATTTVHVVAQDSDALPTTGANLTPLFWMAGGALLVGGAVVLLVRLTRRRVAV